MAKVNWSAGIDSVSGALAKPSKSGQHSCEKMLLGTHRVAATTSSDCNRMVKARSKNLSLMTSDQQAFLAQKDLADGKKTLKSYYWYICGQEYDSEHGNG